MKQVRFGAFLAPTSTWMKPTANKSDDKLYLIAVSYTHLDVYKRQAANYGDSSLRKAMLQFLTMYLSLIHI